MAPRKKHRIAPFTVSANEHRIAMDRTDFLLAQSNRSLQDLIANAYILGVIDAPESMVISPPAPQGSEP